MRTRIVQRCLVVSPPAARLLAPVAASARHCRPRVREGWVRLPPGKMPMMAGFGRLAIEWVLAGAGGVQGEFEVRIAAP